MRVKHIRLTSHPDERKRAARVRWGAATPAERGPVVGTLTPERNAIGAHSGSYSLYRALAIAAGTLDPVHVPDLTDTAPAETIGPHPQWASPDRIVSIDPYGHLVSEAWSERLEEGWDIRPSIAVTKARVKMPEFDQAIDAGRLRPDGEVLTHNGDVRVTKAAIEPVWYLPGIAERFGVSESELRRSLFEQSGGMFAELVTRSDLKLFLPRSGASPSTSLAIRPRSSIRSAVSRAAFTTSATVRTCSAPTSAPAAPTSPTASRSVSRPHRPAIAE